VKTIEDKDGQVVLRLRVQPGASQNAVTVHSDGRLRAAVTAPAAEGAANEALIALLAKTLRVPKSSVLLVRGRTSRDKVLYIKYLTAAHIRTRLGVDEKDLGKGGTRDRT